MKKRIFSLLLVLILALGLSMPAAAFEDHDYLYVAVSDMDNERLLEQGTSTLPNVSELYQLDIRVDIVDTVEDNTLAEYAQIFYEQYEYGYGENKDGVLLMIQVDDWGDGVDIVDYYVYGSGKGEALLATADADPMFDTLSMILLRTDLLYADAGEVCADAVDIYTSTMVSLAANSAVAEEMPEDLLIAPNPNASAPEQVQSGAFIMDEATLLTDGERILLESRAQSLSETYDCGIYVLTVDTMNGADCRQFAENYYTENNLGVGDYRNGILFLVCMDTRDYVTVTYSHDPKDFSEYGNGILAFTDAGIAELEENVVSHLSDGNYNDAFTAYLNACEENLAYYAEHGEGREPADLMGTLIRLAIMILVPLAIALAVCLVLRSQMKTARAATAAGDYIPRDSFALTAQRDQFLHTTTHREKIEKDSDSSSSVSSSGFGGSSGGKF